VGDAARLHDMAEQAEVGEIEAHRRAFGFPSRLAKVDFEKC
jgi:hypothetical protein